MGVKENIKRLREKRDLTQAELADALGVTRSAVTQWESGWSNPKMGSIEQLAAFFDVPKSEIVDEFKKLSSDGFTDVPLYGRIAAGTPLEMDAVEDYYPVPTPVVDRYGRDDVFLLRVEGCSMNRILPDGCYALVERCSEVDRDGQPYAVCVNGYDATIKRVRRLNNGFELAPDSTDPTYQPTVYNYNEPNTETITIIGRVVYHVLPFDWEY